MKKAFINKLFKEHQTTERMPYRTAICEFTGATMQLLFPQISEQTFHSEAELDAHCSTLENNLLKIFAGMQEKLSRSAKELTSDFILRLPHIHELLKKDALAICDGDPAAESANQVIRTYLSFHAIAIYRIAHELYLLNIPLLPRILAEEAHAKTGVEIHPAAKIGESFCIDHGTGIVIGSTCIIGNHVKVYQGVTLGALSVDKSMASMKRHPTIESGVVIYAGATILGGNTVIGTNSIIGGNVWLTSSVESNTTVYHKPQIIHKNHFDGNQALDFTI